MLNKNVSSTERAKLVHSSYLYFSGDSSSFNARERLERLERERHRIDRDRQRREQEHREQLRKQEREKREREKERQERAEKQRKKEEEKRRRERQKPGRCFEFNRNANSLHMIGIESYLVDHITP